MYNVILTRLKIMFVKRTALQRHLTAYLGPCERSWGSSGTQADAVAHLA